LKNYTSSGGELLKVGLTSRHNTHWPAAVLCAMRCAVVPNEVVHHCSGRIHQSTAWMVADEDCNSEYQEDYIFTSWLCLKHAAGWS